MKREVVEVGFSNAPQGTRQLAASLQVWLEARRVVLAMPVSLNVLAEDSPVIALVYAVCGRDAVAVGDIGARLGGMAFCAKRGAPAWRTELGLAQLGEVEP